MCKAAIVILADTQTPESMGRMLNGLMAAKEFDQAGDEVTVIFDGAGVKWPVELSKPEHKYHELYKSLSNRIAGVCGYCAGAYGVREQIESEGLQCAESFEGHPSFRDLVAGGYSVLSF